MGRPLVGALILSTACGNARAPAAASPPPPSSPPVQIERNIDGDSLRLVGGREVRLLGIDAPEFGGSQQSWAIDASAHLRTLLPPGASVELILDRVTQDSFDRLLAHVRRLPDRLEVNREQVRTGRAVTYTIWPNVARLQDYRAAQIEAQNAGRGIWQPGRTLPELPFEYRLRTDGRRPERPAGDYLTSFYVEPASYPLVHVNNRLFFDSDAEAAAAGFTTCPREGAGYSAACFASGR
jgi:endonuclease YncB( thermonuclease family)